MQADVTVTFKRVVILRGFQTNILSQYFTLHCLWERIPEVDNPLAKSPGAWNRLEVLEPMCRCEYGLTLLQLMDFNSMKAVNNYRYLNFVTEEVTEK